MIQRGNNRQACFFADEDYAVYLDWLEEYAGATIELNSVRVGMVEQPAEYRWLQAIYIFRVLLEGKCEMETRLGDLTGRNSWSVYSNSHIHGIAIFRKL